MPHRFKSYEAELPNTQDVLRFYYPPFEIRSLFEILVRRYVSHQAKNGSVDWERIDSIFNSDDRRELTARIRDYKETAGVIFEQAVEEILRITAKMHGLDIKELERHDYYEFKFECPQGHYYRKVLWEGRNASPPPSLHSISMEQMIYTTGNELLKNGRLLCGICEKGTEGEFLSRLHVLRPKNIPYEQQARAVLKAFFDARKNRKNVSKTNFEIESARHIARIYPEVWGGSGAINWEKIWHLLEGVSRLNIPDSIFERIFDEYRIRLNAFEEISRMIPPPPLVVRSREKDEKSLVRKIMMYVLRAQIYGISEGEYSKADPIIIPKDRFGVRAYFEKAEQCYALEEMLNEPRSGFSLIRETRKDKIQTPNPKTGYQSLHNGYLFRGIPLGTQATTHERDRKAERNNEQDHVERRKRKEECLNKVAPPWMRPLFTACLTPDEYRKLEHRYQLELV